MGGGPAGRGGGAMIGPPCGGTVMAGSCRGIGATAVAHCNPGCVMGLTCGDGGAIKAALWVGSAPRAPAMGHPGCRSDHAGLVDRVGGKHGRVGGGGVRGGPVDGTGGEEGRVGGGHIGRLVSVGGRPAGSIRRNGLGFPGTAAGVGRMGRHGLGMWGIFIRRRALRVAGFGIRWPLKEGNAEEARRG
jgi:hypothetical protein